MKNMENKLKIGKTLWMQLMLISDDMEIYLQFEK